MRIGRRGAIGAGGVASRARRRAAIWVRVAALLALLCGPAFAQPAPAPKRGGILEFAVGVELKNYDCYANT
ncbi:MAG: hypothetical protein ACREE9_21800, partial [Stellaceae bacterium]